MTTYPRDVSTQTADLPTNKLSFKSVVSKAGEIFMGCNIKILFGNANVMQRKLAHSGSTDTR